MKAHHWVVTLLVVALAYYAGMKGWLGKAKDAVAGAAGA